MPLGPFDLTGGPFLTLYLVLLAATVVAGLLIPRWLRPQGGATRGVDRDQLALLVGGAARFADTIVARLMVSQRLRIGGGYLWVDDPGGGNSEAERQVLALEGAVRWKTLHALLGRAAEPVEHRLVQSGMLLDRATAAQLRFWQTTPYLLLLGFGSIKWMVGSARDRPVGYLTALLVVTAILAVVRFAMIDRRTWAGQAAVAQAQSGSSRLARAPLASEADLAVALFGTAVLAGSPWAEYHQLRRSNNSNSGDSGSSSSDGGGGGGGGCGGGGCGGCGS